MNLELLLALLLGSGGVGVIVSAYFTYLSKNKETKHEAVNNLIDNLQDEIKRVNIRRLELEQELKEKAEDAALKEEELRKLNIEKHDLELQVRRLEAKLEGKSNGFNNE